MTTLPKTIGAALALCALACGGTSPTAKTPTEPAEGIAAPAIAVPEIETESATTSATTAATTAAPSALQLGGDNVAGYSDTEVRLTAEEFAALPASCVDAEDAEKRRKDYCCHSPDLGSHTIRASNTASAIWKCKKHYPPFGYVSKGAC